MDHINREVSAQDCRLMEEGHATPSIKYIESEELDCYCALEDA